MFSDGGNRCASSTRAPCPATGGSTCQPAAGPPSHNRHRRNHKARPRTRSITFITAGVRPSRRPWSRITRDPCCRSTTSQGKRGRGSPSCGYLRRCGCTAHPYVGDPAAVTRGLKVFFIRVPRLSACAGHAGAIEPGPARPVDAPWRWAGAHRAAGASPALVAEDLYRPTKSIGCSARCAPRVIGDGPGDAPRRPPSLRGPRSEPWAMCVSVNARFIADGKGGHQRFVPISNISQVLLVTSVDRVFRLDPRSTGG